MRFAPGSFNSGRPLTSDALTPPRIVDRVANNRTPINKFSTRSEGIRGGVSVKGLNRNHVEVNSYSKLQPT